MSPLSRSFWWHSVISLCVCVRMSVYVPMCVCVFLSGRTGRDGMEMGQDVQR